MAPVSNFTTGSDQRVTRATVYGSLLTGSFSATPGGVFIDSPPAKRLSNGIGRLNDPTTHGERARRRVNDSAGQVWMSECTQTHSLLNVIRGRLLISDHGSAPLHHEAS